MVAVIPLAALQPDVADRALPEGSQAALTDGDGRAAGDAMRSILADADRLSSVRG